MKNLFPALLLTAFSFPVSAQQFKLEEIMKGEQFTGHAPVNPQWSADGQQLYFNWNPKNEPGNSLYSWSFTKRTAEIVPFQNPAVPAADGEKLHPVHYYSFSGDLFRYNLKTKQQELVISTGAPISDIQRVKNEQHIYFRQNGNLFLFDELHGLKQVTNFRQAITLPEVLVWWAMIPFMIYGIWYSVKNKFSQTISVLLFTFLLTVSYAIFQGNVGTAYRMRAQMQIFYFIFVAVGFVLWQEKKENKKQKNK